MNISRFFAASLDPITLDEVETHHCLHVLRHKVGDHIALFDGKGTEVMAEIVGAEKRSVTLRELNRALTPPLPYHITLVQALPKQKQMDGIVQKATELGVAEIYPVISERSVVQLDEGRAGAKAEKWRQIVVEAAKQCGQNHVPHVHEPKSVRELFDAPPKADLAFIGSLQPGAKSFHEWFGLYRAERKTNPVRVTLWIGPEGDFTPAELNQARSGGCQPVTLGPIVLRSETAALFALSVIAYELQG
jgi:16S rRNA (uracil1498-N3)-methyltransferase